MSDWIESVLRRLAMAALAVFVFWSSSVYAEDVNVPLTLDAEFIESLLREAVFTGPENTRRLNDDGRGCRFLQLANPSVDTTGSQLRVVMDAHARIGTRVGSKCLVATDWRGRMEMLGSVAVADGHTLRLEPQRTEVLTPEGRRDPVASTVWRWAQAYVTPVFATRLVDLGEQLSGIETAIGNLTAASRDEVAVAIDGARAGPEGLRVDLRVQLPRREVRADAEAAPLTQAELDAVERHLEQTDAFFTNVIKQAAGDAVEGDLQLALLEILLDARFRLVEILSQSRQDGRDPARELFLSTWSRLSPLLRRIAREGTDAADPLAYLSFVVAGDALQTLDRLGPAFGLEISTPGLRRMARLLLRDVGADPLDYEQGVDPELRRLFGFTARLDPEPLAHSSGWVRWLIPDAHAAEKLDPDLIRKLNTWVPRKRDLDAYLPMVHRVLVYVADARAEEGDLEPGFRAIFRRLVLTTAWQESCWRQFIDEDRKRVPLHSATGDYGLMQINARVWRGFYDLHNLKWDLRYNARAGAEVLLHYFNKYALRHGEHRSTGDPHNLARSTYAAYNGGPSAYDRYRRKDVSAYARKVDVNFYRKYREMKNQSADVVKKCYN